MDNTILYLGMSGSEATPPLTPIKWCDVSGFTRVPQAMWLLVIGLAAGGMADAVLLFVRTRLRARWQEATDSADMQALLASTLRVQEVVTILSIVASVIVCLGLARLVRAPDRAGVKVLAAVACAAHGLLLLPACLHAMLGGFEPGSALAALITHRAYGLALIVLHGLAMAALAGVLVRLARALHWPQAPMIVRAIGLWIAWLVSAYLYVNVTGSLLGIDRNMPWTSMLVWLASDLLGLALFLYASVHVLRAMQRTAPEEDARAAGMGTSAWQEAASGLELYATALAWRIALAIVGPLLLLAVLLRASPSLHLVRFTSWSIPFVSIIITLIMLAGLRGYIKQPEPSPGRGLAGMGFAVLLGALALDVYTLTAITRALNTTPESWQAAARAVRGAEHAAIIGLCLGFASLLVLLGSFWRVAQHIENQAIEGRIVGVLVLVSLASGLSIVPRLAAPELMAASGPGLLALAAAALSIMALAAHMRLARDLAAALRQITQADLPAARMVEG